MSWHRRRALWLLLLPAIIGLAQGFVSRASAQLYHFGKNKVQFDEFDWQRLETDHFDIYFYPEEMELASFAGQMAEESFRHIEQRLGHTVRRRVPLILYASHVHFEQTNVLPGLLPEGVAGFTEFMKGRVALPLSGSYPEFERVLHHELVHVFMFDRIRRVLADRAITDVWLGPLWFSEGLAEYLSGEWDSYGDMVVRDALFSGRLVPIAQMYRIYGTFQMYKEGQSICEFMAIRYGTDVFARILDNWWRGETFADVFAITTGEALTELDEAWTYDLKKRYLPTIELADPPSHMSEALTNSGFNLKPALLPAQVETPADSLEYVFLRNEQGYTQIAKGRVAGGQSQVIVAGERESAYESLHPMEASLAVSPDGTSLAFVAKRNGRDHLILWDLESGRRRERFTFDALVALSSPTWSADGTRLALAGARTSGQTDLFLVDAVDGSLTELTDDLYHDRDPHWHPTSDLLVFSSDRAKAHGRQGKYNLFSIAAGLTATAATPDIRQLTNGDADDLQPAWSPSGDRIAFTSDRHRFYDLYTLAVDGSRLGAVERLTHTLTGAFDAAWLPAGDELLFTGFEGSRFHIYRFELPAASVADGTDTVLSVAASADSSWELARLPDAGQVTRRSYRKRLSLDIAQSQISQDPVFGTSGGIQLGLSDVLGNDQYYFVLSHISGSDSGFLNGLNVVFGRQHLARQLNVGWGVFRLNDQLSSSLGRHVREKRTGGWVEMSYPFNRHDRLETRFTARHSDLDRQFEGRQLTGWLMSNHLTFTHDTSLWILTGPLEGTRYSIGLGHTFDVKTSRPYHTTYFADMRHYHRLGQRSSFAVRYMGLHSRGDVPETFSMGGSWTLRGYGFRSLWGKNLLLANHELRYPLLDRFVLAFPFGSIDLSALRGALFVDAGNAWNDGSGDWKGSLGAGARLGLGGVFVFRLDVSRRTDFAAIENHSRWDFFFGWDY
jgi:hypothetical protein